MSNAPHQDLRQNLDAFIRKYHRNEMLRGALLLAAAMPMAWLTVLGMEAVGRFGTGARTLLFYAFIAVVSFVLLRYIVLPALRLFRLRGGMDQATAARIISMDTATAASRLPLSSLPLLVWLLSLWRSTRKACLTSGDCTASLEQ